MLERVAVLAEAVLAEPAVRTADPVVVTADIDAGPQPTVFAPRDGRRSGEATPAWGG